MTNIDKLKNVLNYLKSTFVGKDEIIDLLAISLVARENAFLLGPPGTAKSAIIKSFADCITDGKNFEYLLTRFTEPNEIYGPFDIRKLKDGELITNTEGMMPEASLVFLDEIFNANSAILNSLLMALNEKIFRRGKETKKIPALMFVGASNMLPEDDALQALLDRFLIRIKCAYINPDLMTEMLVAGRKLENNLIQTKPTVISDDIKQLQLECRNVSLDKIMNPFVSVVHNLRNAGIKVSDRRAVKIQNIIAASAIICNRNEAILSDLWVMKYIWDTEEQIEILSGIIDTVIAKQNNDLSHPQAFLNDLPNAEVLIQEVQSLKIKWESAQASFEEQNIIKDKLRYIQTRCSWIKNSEHKTFIENEISNLWKIMLQTL